ncbi:MAG: CaiB/BaiF CoA transferase family protein, partial [bacterium]
MADELPLAGLKVLDLSRVLAGPYCTMNLADLGAEVIKVERPGVGDETRSWGPPDQAGVSSYFLSINRNKRSIAVDLSTERGRDLIKALASDADVLIENFKVGGAAGMGLGYGDLKGANPRLVYCAISGFGSTREPADRPGYDLIVQAESGLMSITGSPDGPPNRVGVALVDVLTGQQAAIGILSALHERERTGKGQMLEVSLLDASIASLVNIAQNALATGEDPPRIGPAHPSIVPYQLFEASDGHLMVAAANDPAFERLCG